MMKGNVKQYQCRAHMIMSANLCMSGGYHPDTPWKYHSGILVHIRGRLILLFIVSLTSPMEKERVEKLGDQGSLGSQVKDTMSVF